MTHEKGVWIDRFGTWLTISALGVLPVFFLPITQDYYDTNKWVLLTGATIVILFLWGLRVLMTGTAAIAWNGTIKRLGLLVLTVMVSLLVSPNKVEALLTPFGAGTLIALFIIALIGTTFLDEKARPILRWVILSTTSLAGLLAIYQFFGLARVTGLAGVAGLAFLSDPLWTPVGTSVGLMTILIVTLPLLVAEALQRKRAGHDTHMIVAVVMCIVSLGGLILTAYQVLPKWSATILPYWANWQIMLESYKNWRQLLVGVGAENFLAAFSTGRPAALNMTPLWNTRFTLGSSMLFHIATVYGLIGASAFGYLLLGLLKATPWLSARGGLVKISPSGVSLLLAALSLILLPPSLPAFIVITTILIVSESSASLKRPRLSRLILRYGIAALVFLLAATASYGLVRAYSAELAFGRSLRALENRDGTAAYNLQIQAITRNPRVTRFHTAYSQTNLALANAVAAGTATASAAPDQIDKDRQTTTQLIQQAIREAKLAVNLAPKNILAWENLAFVYQTLTGVAQGANQWAVAAYSQAMTLDPTNPVIRLQLGGAYVGQQRLDQAAESYLTAIRLKPDYANAYYNLAFVYREQKKYLTAAQALKEALKYVTPGSDDGSRAQKELTELRDLLTDEEKRALDEPSTTPSTPPSDTTNEPLSPLP